ncbi:hypothetical protein OESDEN_16578 [Oesophagostomum dentatum]|uniref:Uncharacterized protein n=1 Tax=Oesophagostomum dentatum TaxID=61180 RepID=A0A0B1SKK3_OESDE|nr:hypothetical protein OESDEN_16578 [Oesophagostomum dentatum]
MAERQPMLSFAKVVSGQTSGTNVAQAPVRSASPTQTTPSSQKPDHKSEKRHEKVERVERPEKNEKQEKHDRNFGNRRRPPKYRDRHDKRGNKPEPVKEEKAPSVEEPAPPQEPVMLEPAPLPAVNAWFRKKSSTDSAQALDDGSVSNVAETKQAEEDIEQKDDNPSSTVPAAVEAPKPKNVDPEWPTLDAAKQDDSVANGADSRQHSPTADSAKVSSSFIVLSMKVVLAPIT